MSQEEATPAQVELQLPPEQQEQQEQQPQVQQPSAATAILSEESFNEVNEEQLETEADLLTEETVATVDGSAQAAWRAFQDYHVYECTSSAESGLKCYYAALCDAFGQTRPPRLADVRKSINQALQKPPHDSSQWTEDHFKAAAATYGVETTLFILDSHDDSIQENEYKPKELKTNKKIIIVQLLSGRFAVAFAIKLDSRVAASLSLTLSAGTLGTLLQFNASTRDTNAEATTKSRNPENDLDKVDFMLLKPLVKLYEEAMQAKHTGAIDLKQHQSKILGHASIILKVLKHLADLGLLKPDDVVELKFAGDQNSGKSRLLSLTVGIPVGFSANGTCTRCPIVYSIVCNPELNDKLRINVKSDIPQCQLDETAYSLEEVAGIVAKITASIGDKMVPESIYVTIELSERGSMCLVDLPGMIANETEVFYQDVFAINEEAISRMKVNPKSTLILVTRNDSLESAKVLWGNIIKKHGISKETIERQFVVVLTHAIEMLNQGCQRHLFDECRSWQEFEELLKKPFKRDLLNANFRFFITAVDPRWDTRTLNEEIKHSNFKVSLDRYNRDNESANQELIRLVERIGSKFEEGNSNNNYKRHSNKADFIKRCVGYEALVKHIRERFFTAMKEGYKPIPRIFDQLLNATHSEIKATTKQLKMIEDIQVDYLVECFFEVFSMLYGVVMNGQCIESQKTAPFDKPSPFSWLDTSSLIRSFVGKFKSLNCKLQDVIKFSQTSAPDSNPLPPFPFFVDENDRLRGAPLEQMNAEVEGQFVSRYDTVLKAWPAGYIEAEILIQETIARIISQRPGYMSADDLFAGANPDANIINYMAAIRLKLNYNFGTAFGMPIPQYVARRFASLFWRRVVFVKEFMADIHQFDNLFACPDLMRVIDEVLADQYYFKILDSIQESLMATCKSISHTVDIQSCQLSELYSMLIPLNDNFIKSFMASKPQTPVTDFFEDAVSKSAPSKTKQLVKKLANTAIEALVKPSSILQCESQIMKFPAHLTQILLNPSSIEAIRNDVLPDFYQNNWESRRITDYVQAADTAIALLSLNETQDVMPPPKGKNEVTQEELITANNILHRLYTARKNSFMAATRDKLSQFISYCKDIDKFNYAPSDLLKLTMNKLVKSQKPAEDEDQHANENEIKEGDNNIKHNLAVLLKEQFKLSSPGDETKQKLKRMNEKLAVLEQTKAALDWYFVELNAIDKEKLGEFYDLTLE